MSKRSWRQHLAPASLAAIVIGGSYLFALVKEPKCAADLLSGKPHNDTEHNQERSYGSREVTCHANCQVTFGFEGEETAPETKEADNVAKAANGAPLPAVEERDLCAQARMAWWTRIIALWTAIGAGLLFWTLLLTRKDIEENREQAEFEQRPWLTFQIKSVGERPKIFDGRIMFSAQILTKNIGKSPAMDVQIFSEINEAKMEGGTVYASDIAREFWERSRKRPMEDASSTGSLIFPGEAEPSPVYHPEIFLGDITQKEGAALILSFCVVYGRYGDRDRFVTGKSWLLGKKGDNGLLKVFNLNEIEGISWTIYNQAQAQGAD